MFSPQVVEAFKRGCLDGLAMAGAAFFGTLAMGKTYEEAAIAAGGAFFAALVARVVEGKIDANRQARGDVIPSDVTPIPLGSRNKTLCHPMVVAALVAIFWLALFASDVAAFGQWCRTC